MAKTLEDITFYSKAVIDAQPWLVDPKVLPIPWRSVERKTKLRVAVLWNDGIVEPTPPVTRALKETVEKLKAAGHEIVGTWDPSLHRKIVEVLVSICICRLEKRSTDDDRQARMFVADGGKSVRALLEPAQEPFRPEMQGYSEAAELGTHDMWQLHLERSELQKKYLDQWMSYDGLDAILGKCDVELSRRDALTDDDVAAPTTPYATVAHGDFEYVGYTGVYNVVDYSAVSFPCEVTADREKDQPSSFEPLSDICRSVHAKCRQTIELT